jgi:hypothetical protein
MSYCRWSCDNFKSDVYCYHCVDGTWTTHVAGLRIENPDALPPDRFADFIANRMTPTEFAQFERARLDAVMEAERQPINLPHASETFLDSGPAEMKRTLLHLRGLGYHVPDHAIAALDEEIAEAVTLDAR